VTDVHVGNGGTHAHFCAARAVLAAGDEILLASPYWPLAPGVFTACGAVNVEVPFTQRLYRDPSLDPVDLLAPAVTPRTRAVYFISPNNPDGKVLTPAQLERVAAFARAHDLWVFADEVYADIVFDAATEARSIASLAEMRERTITLHSLSKSHALAGLRIGFVTAPERVITAARRISTHTAFNVSVAMQRVALAALEDDAFPLRARDVYRSARDAAARALAALPIDFHLAEGSTYLFVDFARAIATRGGERPLYAILERAVDRGVLLAPGDAFGNTYASSFARICYSAVSEDRVVQGIERLCDAVDAYVHDRP
jgi:aspartate/methionine/tyrosine aminotransferase